MNEIGSKTLNSSKAAAEPDRREGGLAAISVIGAFLARPVASSRCSW